MRWIGNHCVWLMNPRIIESKCSKSRIFIARLSSRTKLQNRTSITSYNSCQQTDVVDTSQNART